MLNERLHPGTDQPYIYGHVYEGTACARTIILRNSGLHFTALLSKCTDEDLLQRLLAENNEDQEIYFHHVPAAEAIDVEHWTTENLHRARLRFGNIQLQPNVECSDEEDDKPVANTSVATMDIDACQSDNDAANDVAIDNMLSMLTSALDFPAPHASTEDSRQLYDRDPIPPPLPSAESSDEGSSDDNDDGDIEDNQPTTAEKKARRDSAWEAMHISSEYDLHMTTQHGRVVATNRAQLNPVVFQHMLTESLSRAIDHRLHWLRKNQNVLFSQTPEDFVKGKEARLLAKQTPADPSVAVAKAALRDVRARVRGRAATGKQSSSSAAGTSSTSLPGKRSRSSSGSSAKRRRDTLSDTTTTVRVMHTPSPLPATIASSRPPPHYYRRPLLTNF